MFCFVLISQGPQGNARALWVLAGWFEFAGAPGFCDVIGVSCFLLTLGALPLSHSVVFSAPDQEVALLSFPDSLMN